MRFEFLFIFLLVFRLSFSQTKKEQIEILNKRIDSLNLILIRERKESLQKTNEFSEKSSGFEEQIRLLNSTLNKTKSDLSQMQLNLKTVNEQLFNKSIEVKVLENQINEKEKLINNLESQIDKLKLIQGELTLNSKIEIIDKPSFSISDSILIAISDSKMIEPCPLINILGEQGLEICNKQVTKITYFIFGHQIIFFACLGYSFDGAHSEPGQDGFILAEYKNSKWTLIDFLQFQHDGCWGNALEIEDQFILGQNSFGYYSLSCGTAQGFTSCTSYIVGFVNDKIVVLLNEISSEDNLGEGVKSVINWKYKYRPIPSDYQVYSLERKLFKLDKFIGSKTINYNAQTMKYE